MAATPRRQLNNYRFWDCPNHGTFQESRTPVGYTYTATKAGQIPALKVEIVRVDPNARGTFVCGDCRAPLKTRGIVDYATGQEDRRHECGPKCQSATGPNCECRCKGANHGA